MVASSLRSLTLVLPAIWACLTLVAADGSARGATAAGLFDDPVVARGKGFEIRQSEVEDMVTGLRATLASTRNQPVPEAQGPQLAAQMLDRLVLTRIVRQRASEEDQRRAKEIADKFIADTKSKARSEASYRRQLIASGIKPELFESRAFDQALVEAVIDRDVKAGVTVTDDQVRAFYEEGIDVQAREVLGVLERLEKEGGTNTVFYTDGLKRLQTIKQSNLARLERPESVRAQALLVYTVDRITREELSDEGKAAAKERVEQALDRLKRGEDFRQVAKQVSEDPDVEKNGGEYATVRDAVAYPELRQALFTLPIGQLSDIITTRAGYYLARVLERTPAGKAPYDKAEKEIRELLVNQEVQKRLPVFFDGLKKDFDVTYPTSRPVTAPP